MSFKFISVTFQKQDQILQFLRWLNLKSIYYLIFVAHHQLGLVKIKVKQEAFSLFLVFIFNPKLNFVHFQIKTKMCLVKTDNEIQIFIFGIFTVPILIFFFIHTNYLGNF